MRINAWHLVVVFFTMALTSITGPLILSAQAKPPLQIAIKRQELRNKYIQFETIIDALGITEGMTILDIGSGPGYASFLFAEKLHGTGAVFATDIREDFVAYIADEAKRRGLANLFSTLVTEKGLDEFYGKHQYDLVFMANTYHVIDNRIEYFEKLRKFLKPDARLVLVLYNQAHLFSVDDLIDLDGLIKSLAVDTENNPFFQHLSGSTKRLLAAGTNRDAIASAIIDDFNRMLADPHFYSGFYSKSYLQTDNLTALEREFVNWLLMILKEDGVLDKPVEQIDDKAMRSVITLNRVFFKKRLGDYLANGGMGVYIPAGDANRHTSKYEMFRQLKAAGYEFADEIKVSPYFDTVIMAPSAP